MEKKTERYSEVLTVDDVAEMIHETRRKVMELARAGILPGFKLGRRWKFRRDAIADTIERLG